MVDRWVCSISRVPFGIPEGARRPCLRSAWVPHLLASFIPPLLARRVADCAGFFQSIGSTPSVDLYRYAVRGGEVLFTRISRRQIEPSKLRRELEFTSNRPN